MRYLVTEYKRRCKEEFAEYKFKTYRNYHYRITNDVFQSFYLHHSQYESSVTVEFCVLPLSQEYKIDKTTCSTMHLKRFENSAEWFSYTTKNEESVNICIEQMLSYMTKYLMPFFEKTKSCIDAYEMLKVFDVDKEVAFNEYPKMIMALKNEQYLYAKQHIINIIKQSEYAFERNKDAFGENITQEYIQKMEKKISEKRNLLRLIETKEYNTIHEWLTANEKRNKHNLGVKD